MGQLVSGYVFIERGDLSVFIWGWGGGVGLFRILAELLFVRPEWAPHPHLWRCHLKGQCRLGAELEVAGLKGAVNSSTPGKGQSGSQGP